MGTIIEQTNSIGQSFVEFAWPMLVQSSVLILILLIVDFALRKKVRAVFRYWIWMLVLAKLVLPTSLSSPVSLGYWLGDKLPAVDIRPGSAEPDAVEPDPIISPPIMDLTNIDVSSHTPPVEPITPEPASSPVASVTPVTWQGVAFLAWLAVAAAMGLLLLQRAVFVRGLVAQATKADRPMSETLEDCCRYISVRRKVGLKVSPNATTPAVCGLFRPVILVPQNLCSGSGSQHLRTVLLHELAHIKRGDLWVNLAQTVLQIIYFYNPLLWLANAIIRRVREQAVDEAVLVAMGEKAQQYPQTLVDVAKLAFKRPALSLRLIGVVESKSALTARIKHILSRPMPKSAKLGVLGLLAVLITAAVLLPMAAAGKDEKSTADDISEGSQFTATLANGVTVELVGICEHPSVGKRWWRPDGSPLDDAPGNMLDLGGFQARKGAAAFELVAKLQGPDVLQDRSKTPERWKVLQARKVGLGKSGLAKDKSGQPCLRATTVIVKKDLEKIGVEFGIAGIWEKKLSISSNKTSKQRVKDVGIVVSPPYEKDGNAIVTIKVPNKTDEKMAVRVKAILKDGSVDEHAAWSRSSKISFMPSKDNYEFFGLNLSDVDHFEIYTSLYQWVEFRDVSLRPKTRRLSPKESAQIDNSVSVVASVVENNGMYLLPENEELTLSELVRAAGYDHKKAPISFVEISRPVKLGEIQAYALFSRNLETLFNGKESDPVLKRHDGIAGGYVYPSPNREEFLAPYSFGDVVELTINDDSSEGDMFIDLDTAELFTPAHDLDKRDLDNVFKWTSENGIDAVFDTSSKVRGLIGFGMVALSVDDYFWNTEIPDFWDRLLMRIDEPVVISARHVLPATYLIKTNEHKMGVLQILGFTDKPEGVRIRYKLVDKREIEKTDVQVEVEQAAHTVELTQLLEELQDINHRKREEAARKLGELRDTRALEALIVALKDTDVGVRGAAARALGKIADKRAVKPLIETYHDQEYESFVDAIWALGDIGGPRAEQTLVSALNYQGYHPYVTNIAAKCLTKLGWKPQTREQTVRYLIALEDWAQAIKSGPSASLKPEGTNQAEGPFELDIPIIIPLEADKHTPAIAKCPWLQFSTAQGKLKAALHIRCSSWPHTKWLMKVDVLGAGGKVLGQAKSIHSNSGIIETYPHVESAEILFEFAPGLELADTAKFQFSIESFWTSQANPIQFDKELPLALELDSAEQSRTIRAQWVKLEKNGDQVEATIHLKYLSWPKARWAIEPRLLDRNGKDCGPTAIIENSGVVKGVPAITEKDLRFSLSCSQILSNVVRYVVQIQRILDSTAKPNVQVEVEPGKLPAVTDLPGSQERPRSKTNQAKYEGRTIDQWISQFDSESYDGRREAMAALTRIGRPVVPAMIEQMKKGGIRASCAAGVLGKMGPDAEDAVPWLIKVALDKEVPIGRAWESRASYRENVVSCLNYMTWARDRFIPVLQTIAGDDEDDTRLRRVAVLFLRDIGKEAIPILRKVTETQDDEIQDAAHHMLAQLLEREEGLSKDDYYTPLIEKDPFSASVPEYLAVMKSPGNLGRPHPLTQRIKKLYRGQLAKEPDAQLAWKLVAIIQYGLRNTELTWAAPTDGSKVRWPREDPTENFATLAEVLQVGFDHAESGSQLWHQFGISLAKLRLLQGDWDGMNAMLKELGQEPIPKQSRRWLPAPPADWRENLSSSWVAADESMRSGKCSLEFRIEKDGKGLKGAHFLVKRAPEPTNVIQTGISIDTLFFQPYPLAWRYSFGYMAKDRPMTRYAVSDESGIVRFDKLPDIPVKIEVLVPTSNFVEAQSDWDLWMEVEPGKFKIAKVYSTPEEVIDVRKPPAVAELKEGQTVYYPKLAVRPAFGLNVGDWDRVDKDNFVLSWRGID